MWRKATIIADATVGLCCEEGDFTGQMLIDDEYLQSRGVTDEELKVYRYSTRAVQYTSRTVHELCSTRAVQYTQLCSLAWLCPSPPHKPRCLWCSRRCGAAVPLLTRALNSRTPLCCGVCAGNSNTRSNAPPTVPTIAPRCTLYRYDPDVEPPRLLANEAEAAKAGPDAFKRGTVRALKNPEGKLPTPPSKL